VDILEAIAARMGVKAEIVPTSWFALESRLVERR
jgi:hypothetical protein